MKMKKRLRGRGELEIHLQSSQKVIQIKTALFPFGKLLTMELGSTKSFPVVRFVLFLFFLASVTNRVNLSQTNKDHKFLSAFLEN